MKRLAYQPWVGLPNILCRDFVVPELIQERCTPQALAETTMAWLDDGPRTLALEGRFEDLHQLLRQDTARRATDAIAQVIEA
jgi:lipid-A-disaccharide synthase